MQPETNLLVLQVISRKIFQINQKTFKQFEHIM